MKNAKLVFAKGNICLVDGNDMMVNLTLDEFFKDMLNIEFDLKSNNVSSITHVHSVTKDEKFPFYLGPVSKNTCFNDAGLEERNPCKPFSRKQFLALLYLITVASPKEQQNSIHDKSFHFIVENEKGWKVCINLVFNGWDHKGNWYIRAFKTFNYAGNAKDEENKEHVHVFIPSGANILGEPEDVSNNEFMTLLIEGPKKEEKELALIV